MTPELNFAIILSVFATVMILLAYEKLNKANNIAKEAKVKCESAKEEIKSLNEKLIAKDEWIDCLEDRVNDDDSEIRKLEMQIPLFRHPRRFEIKEAPNEYYICVFYPTHNGNSEVELPVKSFPYEDDRDFALLEAQELLDHLNEK